MLVSSLTLMPLASSLPHQAVPYLSRAGPTPCVQQELYNGRSGAHQILTIEKDNDKGKKKTGRGNDFQILPF